MIKKIEEAIKTFNKTVEDTIASLDKLDVTSPSVKNIKDQKLKKCLHYQANY